MSGKEASMNEGSTWHRNVILSYTYQMLYGIAFSVALGPLFDVYLYQIGNERQEGQGNTLVGKIESVSGLIALALVIPIGVVVDSPKFSRVGIMKFSSVVGLLSSVTGAFAIAQRTEGITMWYITMVLNGIYVALGNSVCYALFADSVESDRRPRATNIMAIINNVSMAVGPGLSFFGMLALGNSWTTEALQKVLMFGMVILNPICCVCMFFFEKAPFEGSGVAAEEEEEQAGDGPAPKSRAAKFVPFIVAGSDFITCIGAGMTIKYFNLYWKNQWGMNPTQVLLIAAVQPLSIALFIKLLEKPSEWCGRAQASLACFFSGVFAFIVLAEVQVLPVALLFYFIRSGMANAVYPLNKSIMFDFTPSSQRGRWNAIETLSGSVWSGSAFIGGFLADKYKGYEVTFLITAGIYAVACAAYSPLLCIVPRRTISSSPLKEPILQSPSRKSLISPATFASPGARVGMGFSPAGDPSVMLVNKERATGGQNI